MTLDAADYGIIRDLAARMVREGLIQAGTHGIAAPVFRSASVLTYNAAGSNAQVLVDGDVNPINVMNITSQIVAVPHRGMVMFDPPHGVFLVGYLGTQDVWTGVWTNYSPVLSQPGSITYTNTYCRYTRVGRTVHYAGRITATGAGTVNNPVRVNLPFAPVATFLFSPIGTGNWSDASTGALYRAVVRAPNSTDLQFIDTSSTTNSEFGVLPQVALASGDELAWTVTYEAAS